MLDWLGNRADSLWYWVIAVVFLMLAAWETVRPARPDSGTLLWRWSSNFGIYAVNASILGLLAPAAIIEAYLEARGFPRLFAGLGNVCGDWVVLLAGIVVLDLYAYLLHRVQHASFLLWRLHAVHHADADMDASTTVRHHPGEFVLSSIIGATVAALIGLPRIRAHRYLNFTDPACKCPAAGAARSAGADSPGDTRHASRASLGGCRRIQRKLRHRAVDLGPDVRDLSAETTRSGRRRVRRRSVHRATLRAAALGAAAAVCTLTDHDPAGGRQPRRLSLSGKTGLGQPVENVLHRAVDEIATQMRLRRGDIAVETL